MTVFWVVLGYVVAAAVGLVVGYLLGRGARRPDPIERQVRSDELLPIQGTVSVARELQGDGDRTMVRRMRTRLAALRASRAEAFEAARAPYAAPPSQPDGSPTPTKGWRDDRPDEDRTIMRRLRSTLTALRASQQHLDTARAKHHGENAAAEPAPESAETGPALAGADDRTIIRKLRTASEAWRASRQHLKSSVARRGGSDQA